MAQRTDLDQALAAFHRAATTVPAYQTMLAEAGIDHAQVVDQRSFERLPVLDKASTFRRFPLAQLCVGGEVGRLASVLTSSGHSGVFAFGLGTAEQAEAAAGWIDQLLDAIFQVRSRPTLLINCLPMGVRIPTRACTLAEVSVREDMAVALVKAFGPSHEQIVLVGDAAFLKRVLEFGRAQGVDWSAHRVHVIIGEEPLAENARIHLERLLGIDPRQPDAAAIYSSMGIGEVGLQLFFEAPPGRPLVMLRRLLHQDAALRQAVFGACTTVPSLFAYDPRRLFVEFDAQGRLILTTLDPSLRLPLVRYAPGDQGGWLTLPPQLRPALEAAGIPWELAAWPLVVIHGRGDGVGQVTPEMVKEGIYADPDLAALTTANFRLVPGTKGAAIRIQLSPGVAPGRGLDERFAAAIRPYVQAPFSVACEAYAGFGDGMTLDYERKFAYLGRPSL